MRERNGGRLSVDTIAVKTLSFDSSMIKHSSNRQGFRQTGGMSLLQRICGACFTSPLLSMGMWQVGMCHSWEICNWCLVMLQALTKIWTVGMCQSWLTLDQCSKVRLCSVRIYASGRTLLLLLWRRTCSLARPVQTPAAQTSMPIHRAPFATIARHLLKLPLFHRFQASRVHHQVHHRYLLFLLLVRQQIHLMYQVSNQVNQWCHPLTHPVIPIWFQASHQCHPPSQLYAPSHPSLHPASP